MEKTFIDSIYPYIETPRFLRTADEVVAHYFRKELKKYEPKMYQWHWRDGIEIGIGDGREDQFEDKTNFWINQQYRIGTGRIVESCESSYCINWVDLGDGYRLHYAGFNPRTKERAYKDVMLLDFLYRSKKWGGRYNIDGELVEKAGDASGTKKLRQFIKYVEQMPGCPYNWMIIHPAGSEVMDLYSPHLKSVGYIHTGHTTDQLLKIYRYWLKAKPTSLLAEGFELDGDRYWRLDCFKPIDPMYNPNECPYPKLFEKPKDN